jgi:transglutaminase-like putative cysteine protease
VDFMSSARTGLLWLVLFATAPLEAADTTLFIGQVPVQDARAASAASAPLHYRILHENPAALQASLAHWIEQPEPVDGGVAFSLRAYPVAAQPAADAQHRAASFVIDYTEPVIQALAEPIAARYGERPSPGELEQFVYDYIVDKNIAHGFDVASMVARSRAGDCTEHAVLLTALLRMYGYPARTVTGLYVSLDAPVLAYGHAWAEYYAAGGWRGLDGTRLGHSVTAQHIPLGVVEDESIAYALGLVGTFQMLAVDRVIVE